MKISQHQQRKKEDSTQGEYAGLQAGKQRGWGVHRIRHQGAQRSENNGKAKKSEEVDTGEKRKRQNEKEGENGERQKGNRKTKWKRKKENRKKGTKYARCWHWGL